MSKPVAYVTGYYQGHCVIEPIDPGLVLPVGMALYRAQKEGQGMTLVGDARVDITLERFVELVTVEREKVAQWMMQRGYATGHGNTTEDLLQELAWQIDENLDKARGER